jgi:hypothetical protein
MSLRIQTSVVRSVSAQPGRVRYVHGAGALIPEELVLRRWKDRSKEDSARIQGIRFDGCRLPPGTWTLLKHWLDAGLQLTDVTDPEALQRCADDSRTAGLKLKAPHASKFAAMIGFLQKKGVLHKVLERERDPESPGLPDLFLYRIDRSGDVQGGRFVEVKRWNRNDGFRERLSPTQKDELAFMRSLGLRADVVYLLE